MYTYVNNKRLSKFFVALSLLVFSYKNLFATDLVVNNNEEEIFQIGDFQNITVKPKANFRLGSSLAFPSNIMGMLTIDDSHARLENAKIVFGNKDKKVNYDNKNKVKIVNNGQLTSSDNSHIKGIVTMDDSTAHFLHESSADILIMNNSNTLFSGGSYVKSLTLRDSKVDFSRKSLVKDFLMNNSIATFSEGSYAYSSLTMNVSSAAFFQKSMVETMIMNNSIATFSDSSRITHPAILNSKSILTINNTDPKNLCFIQSVALNDSSRLTFAGHGGTWSDKTFSIPSMGITVNSPHAELAWILESFTNLDANPSAPLIPHLKDIPLQVSEIDSGYKAIISYVQSYKDKTKKTDFSKLMKFYNTDPDKEVVEIPIASFAKGSKLPTDIYLHALADFSEEPVTHTLSYKAVPMDFNTQISDDQGMWYEFGYKMTINSPTLYLTIKEIKNHNNTSSLNRTSSLLKKGLRKMTIYRKKAA